METAVTSPVRSRQTDLRVTATHFQPLPPPQLSYNEPTCGSSTLRRATPWQLLSWPAPPFLLSVFKQKKRWFFLWGENQTPDPSPVPAPYHHTPRFPAAHGDQRPCTPGTQGCPDFLFPTQMGECRGKGAENHKALCNLKVALLSLSKNRAQKISNLRQDSLKWIDFLQNWKQAGLHRNC